MSSAAERQLTATLPPDTVQQANGRSGRGAACCRWHETDFRPGLTFGLRHNSGGNDPVSSRMDSGSCKLQLRVVFYNVKLGIGK